MPPPDRACMQGPSTFEQTVQALVEFIPRHGARSSEGNAPLTFTPSVIQPEYGRLQLFQTMRLLNSSRKVPKFVKQVILSL